MWISNVSEERIGVRSQVSRQNCCLYDREARRSKKECIRQKRSRFSLALFLLLMNKINQISQKWARKPPTWWFFVSKHRLRARLRGWGTTRTKLRTAQESPSTYRFRSPGRSVTISLSRSGNALVNETGRGRQNNRRSFSATVVATPNPPRYL